MFFLTVGRNATRLNKEETTCEELKKVISAAKHSAITNSVSECVHRNMEGKRYIDVMLQV